MACLVRGCRTHSARKKSEEQISFHRFPQDEDLRSKWLELIGRSKCSKFNRICSQHFTSNCFATSTKVKYRRLRENALPTLNLPTFIKLERPAPREAWETESDQEPPKVYYISKANRQQIVTKTKISTPTEHWETESAAGPTNISRPNPQLIMIKTINVACSTQSNALERSQNISNASCDSSQASKILQRTSIPASVVSIINTLSKAEIPTPTEDWAVESAEEPSITRTNPQLNVIKREISTPTEDWEVESDAEPTSVSRTDPQLNVIKTEIPTPTEDWEIESHVESPKYYISRANSQQNVIKMDRPTPREDWDIESPEDPLRVYYISRANHQQNVTKTMSTSNPDQSSSTSRESVCKRYEEIIFKLQHQLQRVKKISEQRLKKLNILRKRNSRLLKRTSELYSIINGDIDLSTIP